ncbi:MAG: DoxX family membrane protein [Flavobacteriaceae bacterium]|nr:DoxX family membrane protein [Flavobacteriaceae bacterium]MCY4266330.1 DoxX family membrane protein [Flavobacteriaceae bacterium]MCY4299294.1 DoxX family membrane protein [Flavobacteriaceae bacterium]
MKKQNLIRLVYGLLRIGLGALMIYAGNEKLKNPIPTPKQHVEKLTEYVESDNDQYLAISAYMGGMKVTGFAYQLLAISEIVFGLLLFIQFTSFIGAIFLIPITLHIFLFHVFLKGDELNEVIQTGIYFLVNLLLITKEHQRWRHLLWIKP